MKPRFLLDENISPRLREAVLRLDPQIEIMRVGDVTAPPLGTLDPELLHYLEREKFILVTNDIRSMPRHLADHFAEGRVHWGVLWIRPASSLAAVAETLQFIWAMSTVDEWLNIADWIPF